MTDQNQRSRDDRQELALAIDASRPGQESAQLPESAEVRRAAGASHKCDALITAALFDVAPPAGLADRLLDAVAAQGKPENQPQLEKVETPDKAPSATQPRARRWPLGLAVAMVVAGLVAMVGYLVQPAGEIDEQGLVAKAPDWFDRAWEIFDELPPEERGRINDKLAKRYPMDSHVLFAARGLQPFTTSLDARGSAVYDLAQPGRQRVYLFVIDTSHKTADIDATPPRNSLPCTRSLHIGAWRTNRLLYVLAVEGGARQYRQAIRSREIAQAIRSLSKTAASRAAG